MSIYSCSKSSNLDPSNENFALKFAPSIVRFNRVQSSLIHRIPPSLERLNGLSDVRLLRVFVLNLPLRCWNRCLPIDVFEEPMSLKNRLNEGGRFPTFVQERIEIGVFSIPPAFQSGGSRFFRGICRSFGGDWGTFFWKFGLLKGFQARNPTQTQFDGSRIDGLKKKLWRYDVFRKSNKNGSGNTPGSVFMSLLGRRSFEDKNAQTPSVSTTPITATHHRVFSHQTHDFERRSTSIT